MFYNTKLYNSHNEISLNVKSVVSVDAFILQM